MNLTFLIVVSLFVQASASRVTEELLDHLFRQYNKKVRPSEFAGNSTVVVVALYIVDLISVNELQQTIKMTEWRTESWNDYRLKWNPDEYGNVSHIIIPLDDVWKPDIILYNTVDRGQLWDEHNELKANIYHNGDISLPMLQISTVRCEMNIVLLPFDSQTCRLQYESWAHNNRELQLELSPHVTKFIADPKNKDPEWEVVEKHAEKYQESYIQGEEDSNLEIYDNIIYYIKFKRNSAYYIYAIIIPTFIINTISLFGTFSPFNPMGERQEKVNLGLTTLLTLAVMIQIVAGNVPRSADGLPLLAKFILIEFVISALATCVSVFVMFLNHRALSHGWNVPSSIMKISCFNKKLKKFKKRLSRKPLIKEMLNGDQQNYYRNYSCVDRPDIWKGTAELKAEVEAIKLILESEKNSNERVQVWNMLLDRLDLYLLIFFIVLNCVVTLLLFRPAFVY